MMISSKLALVLVAVALSCSVSVAHAADENLECRAAASKDLKAYLDKIQSKASEIAALGERMRATLQSDSELNSALKELVSLEAELAQKEEYLRKARPELSPATLDQRQRELIALRENHVTKIKAVRKLAAAVVPKNLSLNPYSLSTTGCFNRQPAVFSDVQKTSLTWYTCYTYNFKESKVAYLVMLRKDGDSSLAGLILSPEIGPDPAKPETKLFRDQLLTWGREGISDECKDATASADAKPAAVEAKPAPVEKKSGCRDVSESAALADLNAYVREIQDKNFKKANALANAVRSPFKGNQAIQTLAVKLRIMSDTVAMNRHLLAKATDPEVIAKLRKVIDEQLKVAQARAAELEKAVKPLLPKGVELHAESGTVYSCAMTRKAAFTGADKTAYQWSNCAMFNLPNEEASFMVSLQKQGIDPHGAPEFLSDIGNDLEAIPMNDAEDEVREWLKTHPLSNCKALSTDAPNPFSKPKPRDGDKEAAR